MSSTLDALLFGAIKCCLVYFILCSLKIILVWRAFGWDAPQYAHLPLILNHDGSKLSKRQNDVRVESYQQRGIMPLALMNFISKAGGGFKELDLDTIYSLDELTRKVSFFIIKKKKNLINLNYSKPNPNETLSLCSLTYL